MPDTILEESERDPVKELTAWVKAFKEKLNNPPNFVSTENAPNETLNPNGKRKGRLKTKEPATNFGEETLRNIKELKKINKQLKAMEKRIARRNAMMTKELNQMKRKKKIRTKLENNQWIKIVELQRRITKLEFQKKMTEKDALIKKLQNRLVKFETA